MKRAVKHRWYYLIAIAAVTFLTIIYGCPFLKPTPPPSSPTSPTTQTPTPPPWSNPPWITGFIDHPSIGKKIQGVKVVATHQEYGIPFPSSSGFITGPDGSYIIFVPFSGTYDVVATHSSYQPYSYSKSVITPNIEYRKDFSMTQSCSGDPVRVLGATSVVYSPTLTNAFSNVTDGAIIHSQSRIFTENFTCDKPISMTLIGGFNTCYSTVNGITILKGNMTLTHGTSTATYLNIQP